MCTETTAWVAQRATTMIVKSVRAKRFHATRRFSALSLPRFGTMSNVT
jgi:hypothetical protein